MTNKKLIIGITAPQSTLLMYGQLQYFASKGYDVYLLAPQNKQTIDFCEKEGAVLLPISIRREISLIHDLFTLIQIIKIFHNVKPDIVNLGTPKVSLLGMIAAKVTSVKNRIYTCRGFRFEHERGFFKKILIFMERITAKNAHKVLCISASVKDLGIENNIFSSEKSVVIHKGSSNGIDLNLFNRKNVNLEKLLELKQHYNIKNKFVFGFLGRIVERKGFSELIEAFDMIYQKDKNVILLVVGRPYYDQIDRRVVEKANNHPGIKMVGLVGFEETPYYYSLMDLFVLPAYWEGFGNVLPQAAALGLPIITTNVTGCKDAVSNNYNATLIPPKDVDHLYKTMIAIKNDPELMSKYSKNGLLWANNFKPEIIWTGMRDMYEKNFH